MSSLRNHSTVVLCFLLFITACTYTAKIKDGTTAFRLKQYAKAIPMLKKEFKKEKETLAKATLAYKTALAYKKINDSAKALEWHKTAYKTKSTEKTSKAYAFALKQNGLYGDAIAIFKELEAESRSDFNYKKQVLACQDAVQWEREIKDNPYSIRNTDWNTVSADYAPTLFENGSIVISSDRTNNTSKENFKWTGQSFSDLYIVTKNEVKPFSKTLNSAYNEGTIAFNQDFSMAVLSRCGTDEDKDNYCQLMVSKRKGDDWSEPKVLPFILDKVNYAHPAWSPDGKALYFSANIADGWGGYDLYKVNYSASGWGEAQLLSAVINTQEDEMFPTWNGDTLYFSSKGHGGMGGLDIYTSYQTQPNQWTKPKNLKAPINSSADDFHLIVTERSNGAIATKGYFSSSRADGKGNDDIYAFEQQKIEQSKPQEPKETPKEKPVVIAKPKSNTPAVVTKPVPQDIFLEVSVLGKTYANSNNPQSGVTGQMPLPNAKLQILNSGRSQDVQTDAQGKYLSKITKNIDYRFFASATNYYSQSMRFNTITRSDKTTYQVQIVLDKIFRNVEINLDNIYYDYNQWHIREDAKPTLNTLATRLLQNPSLQIILGSHTDCRGREEYNKELSQKRAQSVVDYLVSQGVSSSRLQATGYGESSPTTNCPCKSCSEEEHQQNRRTTLLIR